MKSSNLRNKNYVLKSESGDVCGLAPASSGASPSCRRRRLGRRREPNVVVEVRVRRRLIATSRFDLGFGFIVGHCSRASAVLKVKRKNANFKTFKIKMIIKFVASPVV